MRKLLLESSHRPLLPIDGARADRRYGGLLSLDALAVMYGSAGGFTLLPCGLGRHTQLQRREKSARMVSFPFTFAAHGVQ